MFLTNFRLVSPFYTPWKHQEISDFVDILGGIERGYLNMSEMI